MTLLPIPYIVTVSDIPSATHAGGIDGGKPSARPDIHSDRKDFLQTPLIASLFRPLAAAAAWNHHELGIGFPADKNQPAGCCMLGSSDNSRWLSDVWGRIMEHATFARGTRHYNP